MSLDPPDVVVRPSATPFGLARLAGMPDRESGTSLKAEEYQVVDIADCAASAGLRVISADERHKFVHIPPGERWSHPLRAASKRFLYVTFSVTASVGTEIDVGGAKIGIAPGTVDSGWAAVMISSVSGKPDEGEWLPTNFETSLLPYGGHRMVNLSGITVRVDRQTRTWALWNGEYLLNEDVPLTLPRGAPKLDFVLRAGTTGGGGAWICGLAYADENPVFADSNHNALPDAFETKRYGRLANDELSRSEWRRLLDDLELERRAAPPEEINVVALFPDYDPSRPSVSADPIHGMPNTYRINNSHSHH